MKRFFWLVAGLTVGLFTGHTVMAATYNYDDIYTEWSGYETALNGQDINGNPDIQSMSVETSDSGYLQSIVMYFDADYGYGLSNVGDDSSIFINRQWQDTEQYDNWDFYINLENTGNQFPSISSYDLTTQSWSYTVADESGQRIGHPNGIDTSSLLSDDDLWESISMGMTNTTSQLLLTLTFDGEQIYLGDDFVVGYTQYCANDNFMSPVPLPSAIFLLGPGLLGLIGWRRRKMA